MSFSNVEIYENYSLIEIKLKYRDPHPANTKHSI